MMLQGISTRTIAFKAHKWEEEVGMVVKIGEGILVEATTMETITTMAITIDKPRKEDVATC